MILITVFVLVGYLSGNVLYARIFISLLKKDNKIEESIDKNPGTLNAYLYGGIGCGFFTLFFDILKDFVPVYLFHNYNDIVYFGDFVSGLILATPVIGHAFPIFYRFKGGKAVAVTFGCLLGLLPIWQPFIILSGCFAIFLFIIKINSHFHRTLVAYITSDIMIFFLIDEKYICLGFSLITIIVFIKLFNKN